MTPKDKQVVLMILGGWGITPAWSGNILNYLNTPHFHNLWKTFFHINIEPFPGKYSFCARQGSEISFANIGTGRINPDEGDQINEAIKSGVFLRHTGIQNAFRSTQGALHIVSLVDTRGKHSRLEHLAGLLIVARGFNVPKIFFHLGLMSGDDPNDRAYYELQKIIRMIEPFPNVEIASLFGSNFVLENDNKIKSIKILFNLLTRGHGLYFNQNFSEIFDRYYQKGGIDNTFPPSALNIDSKIIGRVNAGDTIIIANLKIDSIRPFVKIFDSPNIVGTPFDKKKLSNLKIYTFFNHGMGSKSISIFNRKTIPNPLSKVLSDNKLTQLKIAHIDKKFQIGYYFNGGNFEKYDNENRKVFPISRLDQNWLLGADEIYWDFKKAFLKRSHNFYLVSFSNADLLGHFGDMDIASKAIKKFDNIIGEIANITLERGADLIITADHGNAEEIIEKQTGEHKRYHTTNPVPFIFVSSKNLRPRAESLSLEGDIPPLYNSYTHASIAPTILDLFGLIKPSQMSDEGLITNELPIKNGVN
ncbi:hypothetical protein AUK14_01260 [Candidatus Berkelbacteria bacterium CG2_30_39_44]|uniref:phosphoglycerate mutase (2,3-diphosphoglycerate-independent) n=1 Tax=Candidatus Berkelbacteria bacterium CG03_land_8_20_14_0_80_40_36 TaxID=1974509 RepID=A0A2M7CHD5_9BACT|nr:MAG: hypothetical protein AUK14_01260 [Candidatus Berkelbacteria bacterium CG2_30_39_44]PIV25053.1 MAG: hypothetical protein COS38_03670 [Candidatus Berkelbacteria bacterium CG03_land_8_20_14_0_80_40_36]PIX30625.1 MAG: hypothetical protein COZ62_01600 [Candidatus Berkelbacteria bacterium CG_4_8_14_3_um_filter_39_27]PIZ29049.1 MAG: hypothetical protein COY44_00895 [Candidatus Berkelbacteria bacterium CG_4_10_14_0_8_um_filter_39_42]